MDEQDRADGRDEGPEPGAPPTLGNAVYRWADATIRPLPFAIRVTIIGVIIAFLVFLPLALFLVLLSRG